MLALVGSGEYLPGMEAVDRELLRRLAAPPRVVCLPTAAGQEGPERIAYWSDLGVAHFSRLGADVQALPVIDRASADDAGLAAAIAEANFVYLSGGKPSYLRQTLAGSRAWQAIEAVLARGGLLAGCSAGAMIMAEKILGLPLLESGFNFLPGSLVMPHYDELSPTLRTLIRWRAGPRLTLVGVEGYTALVINKTQAEVLGTGGVTLWGQAGPIRYQAGPLPAPLAVKAAFA